MDRAIERIVLCHNVPEDVIARAMEQAAQGVETIHVPTLGDAIAACLHLNVKHLMVRLSNVVKEELHSLTSLRKMRPGTRITIYCPRDMHDVLMNLDCADQLCAT